jgi:hypothetical protein
VTRWPARLLIADVAVDPDDGNLFVCGSSAAALVVTNSAGVSTTLHAAPTTTDGWAFRVDGMTGNVSTATSAILKIAGPGTETCKAFKILPGGGRVIAGSITQSVTLGAVTLTHTNSVADSFVMTATPSNAPVTSKMFNITTGAASPLPASMSLPTGPSSSAATFRLADWRNCAVDAKSTKRLFVPSSHRR